MVRVLQVTLAPASVTPACRAPCRQPVSAAIENYFWHDAMAESTFAPLQNRLFRMLWLAALVSNVGAFMQMVGAQWMLVHGPHAALLVSLVQTVDMTPDLLFGLAGGALADIFDRRRVLIVVQSTLAVFGAILTVLTFTNRMGPALLLTLTFILGAGSVFANPAYQAMIPDLVPRAQVNSAAALASISVNLARAAGPAVAGFIIARAGVGAVFAINTAAFVVYAVVVALWHPPHGPVAQVPEPFGSAVRAGTRYIRHSRVVRRTLLRATLFLVPASALWALLPLVASQHLGLGAGGYGLMLASLGAGAIIGAFFLPRVTSALSTNGLVVATSVVFAASTAAAAVIPWPVLTCLSLLPAGVAWIALLSNINGGLQLFLPGWVRARGISIYLMIFFGSQALGSIVWGLVAGQVGLQLALLIAGASLLAGAATIGIWPMIDTSGMDRSNVAHWPAPRLVVTPAADSGPVVVRTTYTVAPENEAAFLRAMPDLRRSRLRTGAIQWGIFRDGEQSHEFVELFVVPSWDEHIRQHDVRLTGTDRDVEAVADKLSDPPPRTSHLIPADPEIEF